MRKIVKKVLEKTFIKRKHPSSYDLCSPISIHDIKKRTLSYVKSMALKKNNSFAGYLHSKSTSKPVLYSTVLALLLKHLYGETECVDEELDYMQRFQSTDGLYKDPVIQCQAAETEDWWGWRHLTLHALMVHALYDVPLKHRISYLDKFKDKDKFRKFLLEKDWGKRVAFTSNELQNIGVMLQYSRDFQNDTKAGELLSILYEIIIEQQDETTGLFGNDFQTLNDISNGIQAGYHFWLLLFYDDIEIEHSKEIIDNILRIQNILGGYGVQLNSSACEDIDGVDPLLRLVRYNGYRKEDVLRSLNRAFPWILNNLNSDGGWVFRRHEELRIFHPQMYSASNESNMFYTWFRTLGLAYCLKGMETIPEGFKYEWNFKKVPGHQFL